MNHYQQISLKLQLGLDPASKIQPEQLLEKWQAFSEKRSLARSLMRRGNPAKTLQGTFQGAQSSAG